jgi:hypothetical protein
VWIPHPVAILNEAEIRKLAREAADSIVGLLTRA